MNAAYLSCPRCQTAVSANAVYCPRCGEPLNPTLVRELQWTYTTLQELDQRIAAGQGDHTLQQFREELRTTYEAIRKAPAATSSAAPPQSSGAVACPNCHAFVPQGLDYCPRCGEPMSAALITQLQWMHATLTELDRRIANGEGGRSLQGWRDELSTTYTTKRQGAIATPAAPMAGQPNSAPPLPTPVAPVDPEVARRNAFDQAINVLAYLGGLLLLIATLAFEVGTYQAFTDTVKLITVIVVYVFFGLLGFLMRRSAAMHAVGQAYLGVFALMSPLVGLAVYLFALQGLQFSAAAMVTISALYTMLIFLILATRVRFATYAYLGWVAFIVAALAFISWLGIADEWQLVGLTAAALILLVLSRLQRVSLFAAIATPAFWVATVATAATFLWAEGQGFYLWVASTVNNSALIPQDVFAINALALVVLAGGYSYTLRVQASSASKEWVAIADWFIFALAAQAVIAVMAWVGIDRMAMAAVLAGAGFAEFGGAFVLRRVQPARTGLRIGVEVLALVLSATGTLLVTFDPLPNTPLILTLVATSITALGIALAENAPWWTIASGISLSFAYRAVILTLIGPPGAGHPATIVDVGKQLAIYHTGLALGFWLVAFLLGFTATRARGYAAPLYITATVNALYILLLPSQNDPLEQSILLSIFAVASLIAARREEQPVFGGFVVGFWGIMAVDPAIILGQDSLTLILAAVIPAVFAAIVRVTLGRTWAYGPYAVAVWASLFAVLQLYQHSVSPDILEVTLLGLAAVAYVIAIIDRSPWMGLVPAFYASGAVSVQPDAHLLLPTALGLTVAGVIAGRIAGIRWSWPMYTAAAVATIATVSQSAPQPEFQALALASLTGAAYLVALVESRADILVAALALGVAALATAANAFHLASWQTNLAFVGLSWLYGLLQLVWRILPLRMNGVAWWAVGYTDPAQRARYSDPRLSGVLVHRGSSLVVAISVALIACGSPDNFTPWDNGTLIAAVTLLAFAGLLAFTAIIERHLYALFYLAGGMVALASAWGARWLGADNTQAYVLVPGSYLIIIGALLPQDRRVGQQEALGVLASIAGALTLMLPTLVQSFDPDVGYVYALVLTLEALLVTGLGVGMRSATLLATGLSFVGLAALRGAVLAITNNVPIFAVIAIFAVLLMGAATLLSLYVRRRQAA